MRKNGQEMVVEKHSSLQTTPKEASCYQCWMCGLNFQLLSSFLLHIYRHSDPLVVQKDIKKEEEKENSYLKEVNEVSENIEIKKEEDFVIKEEEIELKTEENQLKTTFEAPKEVENIETHQTSPSNQIQKTQNYECHYCTSEFSSKKLLKRHLRLHALYFDHQRNSTKICDFCFELQENLVKHYFTSHKRSSRICRICDVNIGSNSLRQVHEKFFHDVTGFDCNSCQFGFKSVKKISEHLKIHENEDFCKECRKKFGSKEDLIKHGAENHPFLMTKNELESLKILLRLPEKSKTENFQCSFCDKKFSTEKLAKLHETRQHLSSKNDDPGYNCTTCGATFSKRANGLRHARRMHGIRINNVQNVEIKEKFKENPVVETKFSCDQCEKSFVSSGALISHSKKAHPNQELIFQCGICEKRLKNFPTLKEHIEAVHEKKFLFFCDICGKGFARKSGLRSHMKVNHITSRDFPCPICNQTFAQLNQLNAHKKIHSTKKLHTCNICQKSFAQLAGLSQHLAMHSETPKYLCTICNLSFKYASSFYNHRKSHVSPSAHKCEECGRECPSRFSLYVHRKTHHSPMQQFDCSDCGKVFKRKKTLKYHILNKHTNRVNYKCEYCENEGFKTKREQKRHISEFHMQFTF
ncbi:zinc finger protein 845-like [Culicoides brevitarsis]|uniref:zinc finger protein 845-like n=1 Tax=Culicoides brevitarsis TaxID=469753 RepID=UPI00307B4C21